MSTIRRVRGRALMAVVLTAVFAIGGLQAASAVDEPQPPAPASPITPSTIDAERRQGSSLTSEALAITAPSAAPAARNGVNVIETGSLTGHVEAFGGDDIAGALVSAYRIKDDVLEFELIETVATDAGGVFAFEAIPVGSYDLFFNPPFETWSGVSWGWHGGGPYPNYAGPVRVEAGANTLDAIHVLYPASEVGGVVKSEAGLKSLNGVPVTLWGSNGPQGGDVLYFTPLFQVTTENGGYSFPQMPDGYYIIRFDSPSAKYAGEWWRNKSSFATSDMFTTYGPSVMTVNANLASKVDLGTVSVSGASATGATLRANHRTVAGTTYKYGWFADGVYISGANKSTFVPTAAQQHKRITVRVTGSKTGVVTTTKSSEPRGKTLLTAVPTISGTTALTGAVGPDTSFWKGSTLTAKAGTWTSGATLAYQWYADGKAISGANSTKYTLKPADKYKRISVKVTGSKEDYGRFGRTSAPTARIATVSNAHLDPNPTATRPPGTKFGPFIFAGTGSQWAPGTSFVYYFYADGALVQAGPGSMLGGLERFIGKRIQARVVASNPGYDKFTMWTNKTNPVTW